MVESRTHDHGVGKGWMPGRLRQLERKERRKGGMEGRDGKGRAKRDGHGARASPQWQQDGSAGEEVDVEEEFGETVVERVVRVQSSMSVVLVDLSARPLAVPMTERAAMVVRIIASRRAMSTV